MKFSYIFSSALIIVPGLLHGQAQDDYVNWVRQIQTEINDDNTVVRNVQDITVASEGLDSSPLPIPIGGALFQLWTLNSLNQETWLLDTAIVGSARPQANITITSQDSFGGVARTRADVPYSVSIEYFNLQEAEEGVAAELTQVRSFQSLESASATDGNVTLVSDETITENSTVTQDQVFTRIQADPGLESFQAKGTETFVVESITETGTPDVLNSAKIEIFPLSTGALTNLGEQLTISRLPDNIGIQVDDAYPGSELILEVTIHPANGDPSRTIEALHRNISTLDSEDINIEFSEYTELNYANNDRLTFSLIAVSAFDTIVLFEEERIINDQIIIRGSLNGVQ